MTRNILKTLIVLCTVSVFITMSVFIIQPIFAKNSDDDNEYNYHIQVLVDSNNKDKSSVEFKENLIKKGIEKKIYVELIDVEDSFDKEKIIEQGIYAKVDGIACTMENKKIADSLYNKAEANKVALMDYGMNPFKYEDMLSTGIDSKHLAYLAVEEVCSITKKSDKILVFLNNETYRQKKLNKKIIKEYKKQMKSHGRDKDSVKFIKVSCDKYKLSTYIKGVLEKYDKYDAYVCLDSKYSSIIGNIIENNEISRLDYKNIVAYGDQEVNMKYLKEGMFDKIITPDGEDIAEKLINTYIDSIEKVEDRNYIANLKVINYKNKKFTYNICKVEDSK